MNEFCKKKVGSENKASAFYDKQMLDYLNPYMRDFISKQEMVFIATADSKGKCDCSFRAGKQWFVKVLNEKLFFSQSIGETVSWPAWEIFLRINTSV